jgi:prepilin-type N-terminal cleavage/methylation domain-containing protein
MLHKQGFTLMEIIVVLTIIGVAVAFAFPNFNTPSQQARALSAQNNFLAIYSAEQNNNNNNKTFAGFAPSAGDTDGVAAANTALSLNLQDDGTYVYTCVVATSTCTATSNGGGGPNFTMLLNAPIQLNTGNPNTGNPTCSIASLCP